MENEDQRILVDDGDLKEGHGQAMQLLHRCLTKEGLLASPAQRDNYNRIWGRDSCVIGLAALLSGDEELIDGCRRSLETLVGNQGPHGEIPSNVDPETGRVSYGGTAGRIDADLWFLIVAGELCVRTQNGTLVERFLPAAEKVRWLLGAWEFNNRGLLYTPPTGDWADEYLHSGYVLYDQLLYYQAQRALCTLHALHHNSEDHALREKTARLKHLIEANYWFNGDEEIPEDVYHPILFKQGRRALPEHSGSFWLPFFSPLGYGYRFDALANALVPLLGIGNEEQGKAVDRYIDDEICIEESPLLPAFCPVIMPQDKRWDELKMTFSYQFKNEPYEYHNGGLWPMVNGFYAAGLAARGRKERAHAVRKAVHAANRLPDENGDPWSFAEFVHGKKHTAGGMHPMGWSAAGALIADAAIDGQALFACDCEHG